MHSLINVPLNSNLSNKRETSRCYIKVYIYILFSTRQCREHHSRRRAKLWAWSYIISFGYFIFASKRHVLEVMGSPSSRHCESRLNDKKKGLSPLSIFHFVSSSFFPHRAPSPLRPSALTSPISTPMLYYGNWLTV